MRSNISIHLLNLDEAIKQIREEIGLERFKTNGGTSNIVIVREDHDLLKYLQKGYEIVKELSDGRIILKH